MPVLEEGVSAVPVLDEGVTYEAAWLLSSITGALDGVEFDCSPGAYKVNKIYIKPDTIKTIMKILL